MPCRSWIFLLTCWSCVAACSDRLHAETPPESGNLEEEALTLDQLIDEWRTHAQNTRGGSVEFLIRSYYHSFGVEQLSEGRLTWTDLDHWTFTTHPREITQQMRDERAKPGVRVRRRNGQPYQLESQTDTTTWTRRANKLTLELTGQDVAKTFTIDLSASETMPAPALFSDGWWQRQLAAALRSPAHPAAVLLSPLDDALGEFDVEISESASDEPDQLCLKAVYTSGSADSDRPTVFYRVNSQTYRPIRLRVVEASGMETVYSFTNWKDAADGDAEP